jgi:hypothetical protein
MKTTTELLQVAQRYAELMGYEFYCISVRSKNITFQGNYDSNLVKHLNGCGYKGYTDENGYFIFDYYEGDDLRNEKIQIVLT